MPSEISISTKPWKVRDLVELKQQGRLHLPDLQRGFRWTPERVRDLFDSLYRHYPVGALLLVPAVAVASENPLTPRQWLGWTLAASLWGHYSGSAESTYF